MGLKKSFRIYTERLNEEKIKELLSLSFDGFTVIYTKGFWKKTEENGLIVEIITSNETLIRGIAKEIKRFNNQDAVLITSQSVDCELV